MNSSERLRKIGVILLIGGVLGLGIPAFSDPPPGMGDLQPVSLELSKTPFLRKTGKTGTLGLLCFTDQTLRLPNVCSFWGCDLPEPLRKLAPGARVVVWRHDMTAWQIAHAGRVIYSHAQAVEAEREERRRMVAVFVAVGLIGGLFILFNRRRPE